MNNKGFTLVEILAVVVILGVIALITVPVTLSIIDRSKQNMYDRQISEITEAARMYVSENSTKNVNLSTIGYSNVITLQQLSDDGYIDLPITNTLTNQDFDPDCLTVTIVKGTDTYYDYTVNINGAC